MYDFFTILKIETELEYAVGENGEQVEDEDEDEDNTYVPSEEDESEDEDLESELDAQLWLQDVEHPSMKRHV